jgi:hypothetical protein
VNRRTLLFQNAHRAHSRKGQSAVEFVLLASVALVGVAVLLIAAQRMFVDVQRDQTVQVVGALVEAVQGELVLAEGQPAGYERTFMMPRSFDGYTYTIRVRDEDAPLQDAVLVEFLDVSFLFFTSQELFGDINPGVNTLRKNSTHVIFNG